MNEPTGRRPPKNDPLAERLRAALAQQAQARADLEAARAAIDEVIAQMRSERRPWRKIAGYVPQAERSREAHRLSTQAYRRRHVTRGDGIRPGDSVRTGRSSAACPPFPDVTPSKEIETMTIPRLIKRRTVEEIFDDRACPTHEIDDSDNDAFDDGDDEVVAQTSALRGEPADKPVMNGGDLDGTDGADLEGDDE